MDAISSTKNERVVGVAVGPLRRINYASLGSPTLHSSGGAGHSIEGTPNPNLDIQTGSKHTPYDNSRGTHVKSGLTPDRDLPLAFNASSRLAYVFLPVGPLQISTLTTRLGYTLLRHACKAVCGTHVSRSPQCSVALLLLT